MPEVSNELQNEARTLLGLRFWSEEISGKVKIVRLNWKGSCVEFLFI
jgi:hypothetical protein